MTSFRQLVAAAAITLGIAAPAAACEVRQPLDIAAYTADADLVVEGRIVAIDLIGTARGRPEFNLTRITIDVGKTLKGAPRAEWTWFWWNTGLDVEPDWGRDGPLIIAATQIDFEQLFMRGVWRGHAPPYYRVMHPLCSDAFLVPSDPGALKTVRAAVAERR